MPLSAHPLPVLLKHPIYPRFIREVTEDNEILAVYHYGRAHRYFEWVITKP